MKLILIIVIILFSTSCIQTNQENLTRFSTIRMDIMDTVITFIGYSNSESDFYKKLNYVQDELTKLHNLFTTFEEIEGLNNLYYVNKMAGVEPVVVDPIIIELLQTSIDAYEKTNGNLNIALGSVLEIWHNERISSNPSLPSILDLRAAGQYANIENILIDTENNTVFITDKNTRIDVGSIAKGFSIERAISVARDVGFRHFLISAGGDVRMLESSPETGRLWGTAIQDPNSPYTSHIDVLRAENVAIFTSGNYQRFFEIDGIRYHHIIDPRSFMPANFYSSITVIHENSIYAEILTTALFMISIEDGMELLEKIGGEALWITIDGKIHTSRGYSEFSDNF
ncbi:MAG: FAD:protein FMN transferase [Defluviitaleaceae bacterium]|nr:FAD:protein FMN transferase [Defluviitaleaceae bacterium]